MLNEIVVNLFQGIVLYFLIKWLFLIAENVTISKKAAREDLMEKLH